MILCGLYGKTEVDGLYVVFVWMCHFYCFIAMDGWMTFCSSVYMCDSMWFSEVDG